MQVEEGCRYSSYLKKAKKAGASLRAFSKFTTRWFTLDIKNNVFTYSKKQNSKKPDAVFSLSELVHFDPDPHIAEKCKWNFAFSLQFGTRNFMLHAESLSIFHMWSGAFKELMKTEKDKLKELQQEIKNLKIAKGQKSNNPPAVLAPVQANNPPAVLAPVAKPNTILSPQDVIMPPPKETLIEKITTLKTSKPTFETDLTRATKPMTIREDPDQVHRIQLSNNRQPQAPKVAKVEEASNRPVEQPVPAKPVPVATVIDNCNLSELPQAGIMDLFDDFEGLLQSEHQPSPFKDISNSPPQAQGYQNPPQYNPPKPALISAAPSYTEKPVHISAAPHYTEQPVAAPNSNHQSKSLYSEVPSLAPACQTEANGNQYDWDSWDD